MSEIQKQNEYMQNVPAKKMHENNCIYYVGLHDENDDDINYDDLIHIFYNIHHPIVN